MSIKFDPKTFQVDLGDYDHESSKIRKIEICVDEEGNLKYVCVERHEASKIDGVSIGGRTNLSSLNKE